MLRQHFKTKAVETALLDMDVPETLYELACTGQLAALAEMSKSVTALEESLNYNSKEEKTSCLFTCCAKNDVPRYGPIVQWLVSNGARVDMRNEKDGDSPLHACALNNNSTLMNILLTGGIGSVNVKNKQDQTPL
jgi:ankyrin repeat protein